MPADRTSQYLYTRTFFRHDPKTERSRMDHTRGGTYVRTYYSDSPSIKSKGRRFKSINNLIIKFKSKKLNLIIKIKCNEYINKKNVLFI